MKSTLLIIVLSILTSSCSIKGENALNERVLSDSTSFVDRRYLKVEPLGEIIDVPIRTEISKPFELANEANIQIYGVGELLYNLAGSKSEYFLKGDDTELFFSSKNKDPSSANVKKTFVFSWEKGTEESRKEEDKKNFIKILSNGGVSYGYRNRDSLTQKYISLIKIPLEAIGILKPFDGLRIYFDIIIGDADDYFAQNNKLSWHSSHDLLVENTEDYGYIEFKEKEKVEFNPNVITSLKATLKSDWGYDQVWTTIKPVELTKDIFGTIKDKYDLSAKVKSCWTSDTLYFYVETQDSQRKRIGDNTKRKKQTFADYGWIEDSNHHKVWEMHALDTKYAGGALKNHKIDTVIHLKRGKYFLKYLSDESHAWNDWDDTPPHAPFYGIIAFKALLQNK
jgi:hypothetical protein